MKSENTCPVCGDHKTSHAIYCPECFKYEAEMLDFIKKTIAADQAAKRRTYFTEKHKGKMP